MLKKAGFIILLFCCKLVTAQYYFQDIVTAGNTSKNFNTLVAGKVKKVTVSSIEPDGSVTENFGITQEVNARSKELITNTVSGITGSSLLITGFNKQDLPATVYDSAANSITTVSYTYDALGKLLEVLSESREAYDSSYIVSEDHVFEYDTKGQLLKMLKIKNRRDTVNVIFVQSENGLPGEEQWWSRGRKIENWYYYYDDKGQLTDIVRYNARARKMLPDYTFEYDDDGRISQQTVVQAGTNFYRVWIYEYKENGLKKAETIFNKGKEQEARILYEYE